jgi:hypothetical protein
MAVLLPLMAGCAGDPPPMPEPAAAAPPEMDVGTAAPPLSVLPPPPATLTLDEAAALLRGDPMALRFLAMRALAENDLVSAEDAAARRDANMGALLPLTAGSKPAADSDLPIPPIDAILDRFRTLKPGSDERAFLLDQVLARRPEPRVVMAPHDRASARTLLLRLGRLEDAGLITPEQRAVEQAAVDALMATLPEALVIPEPENPEKPAVATGPRGGGSSARRMPGGVSGKLEVIPSPTAFEPPKISAEFTGKAGVHLLSMATASYGDKAWEALTNQFKQELAGLSFAVQKADLGELGVTYRLIAGPMEAAAAERLCGVIRQKGQACMPTPFPQ